MERSESQKKWSNVVFGVLFLGALLLFGRIMLPFVMPVLLGGFLTVLFMPLNDRLCRLVGQRRALSAGLSTLAVVALIVIPLGFIAYFVGRELMVVVEGVRKASEDPQLRESIAAGLPAPLRPYVLSAGERDSEASALLATISGSVALLRGLLGRGTQLAIDLFLMAVSMYYFFIDGRRIYDEFARLVPIETRYLEAFAKEFKDVAYAIVYGNTLTALVQAGLGLFGLWVAGVPHPLVWAGAMAVVALIPIGGTALVWLPAAVALALAGKVPQALFLVAWGALVVSTVDNLLRPRLCGSRMTLHPLMVFLSMFGGLAVFGMMGLLVGPLIASMFMAMVRIYRRDFLAPTTAALRELAAPRSQQAS